MDQQARTSRLRLPAVAILSAFLFAGLAASCSSARDPIVLANDVSDASGSAFVAPSEAGIDASEGGLIQYCPSSRCPEGHFTCPSSYFACDIDLQTDIHNCGACGVMCPTPTASETFECSGGRCVMHCNLNPTYFDCNGVPDDGCEILPSTNENCGACGNVCTDPAKPCIEVHIDSYACGCPGNSKLCPPDAIHPTNYCITDDDDQNCGACGNACNPAGDGTKPIFANEHFGCEAAKCNNAKCDDGFLDCDGVPTNGCEASIFSDTSCGGCGKACAAGQKCVLSTTDHQPFCACPPDTTFCGSCPPPCTGPECPPIPCAGSCVNLTSDVGNCGGCGLACGGQVVGIPACSYGSCQGECPSGSADCNGNPTDACEVRTDVDPNNCGGCGITCDLVAGQACVAGRCVVEPCNQVPTDAGGTR